MENNDVVIAEEDPISIDNKYDKERESKIGLQDSVDKKDDEAMEVPFIILEINNSPKQSEVYSEVQTLDVKEVATDKDENVGDTKSILEREASTLHTDFDQLSNMDLFIHSFENARIFSVEDSTYAQENPEGQDMLNDLFERKQSRLLIDEGSYPSRSEQNDEVEIFEIPDLIFHRLEIIDKLKSANDEKRALVTQNNFHQSKLSEYFRMVKVKQTVGMKLTSDKESLMDFNTQYIRYGEILHNLMKDLDDSNTKFNDKISRLKAICSSKIDQVNKSTNEFVKHQEHVGQSSLHSRTGNKLDHSVIIDYIQSEAKKELVIKEVRLNNLKIEHKNNSLDKALRSKEDFEGGLRLIDFEQLKIENQTFNEKVEDREEAIDKLNKKIGKCNHLLSHIKEKIDLTDKVKKISRVQSKTLDRDFKKVQKANNKAKKMRDNMKTNNRNLQLSCGLLGKKDYLRSYQNISEYTDKLRGKIETMEAEKRHLMMNSFRLSQDVNRTKNK